MSTQVLAEELNNLEEINLFKGCSGDSTEAISRELTRCTYSTVILDENKSKILKLLSQVFRKDEISKDVKDVKSFCAVFENARNEKKIGDCSVSVINKMIKQVYAREVGHKVVDIYFENAILQNETSSFLDIEKCQIIDETINPFEGIKQYLGDYAFKNKIKKNESQVDYLKRLLNLKSRDLKAHSGFDSKTKIGKKMTKNICEFFNKAPVSPKSDNFNTVLFGRNFQVEDSEIVLNDLGYKNLFQRLTRVFNSLSQSLGVDSRELIDELVFKSGGCGKIEDQLVISNYDLNMFKADSKENNDQLLFLVKAEGTAQFDTAHDKSASGLLAPIAPITPITPPAVDSMATVPEVAQPAADGPSSQTDKSAPSGSPVSSTSSSHARGDVKSDETQAQPGFFNSLFREIGMSGMEGTEAGKKLEQKVLGSNVPPFSSSDYQTMIEALDKAKEEKVAGKTDDLLKKINKLQKQLEEVKKPEERAEVQREINELDIERQSLEMQKEKYDLLRKELAKLKSGTRALGRSIASVDAPKAQTVAPSATVVSSAPSSHVNSTVQAIAPVVPVAQSMVASSTEPSRTSSSEMYSLAPSQAGGHTITFRVVGNPPRSKDTRQIEELYNTAEVTNKSIAEIFMMDVNEKGERIYKRVFSEIDPKTNKEKVDENGRRVIRVQIISEKEYNAGKSKVQGPQSLADLRKSDQQLMFVRFADMKKALN